jgi:cell division protein FtsN
MRWRQEIRLDSRQVGLLVAGGVLMVLVVFALGVLAGRLYFQEGAPSATADRAGAPPSPQAALPGVGPGLLPPLPTEPVAGQEASKAVAPSSGDQEAKPSPKEKASPEDLTFYQTLTSKEKAPHVALQPKETSKETKAAKEAKKQPAGTVKKEAEKTKTPSTAGRQVAKKEQPAKEPPAAGKPSGKRFTVQVGAFKERRDAEQLLLSLKDKGYSARLDVAEISGKGTWFRVRVGKFANRAEADHLVTKLQDQEKRPAIVVTE